MGYSEWSVSYDKKVILHTRDSFQNINKKTRQFHEPEIKNEFTVTQMIDKYEPKFLQSGKIIPNLQEMEQQFSHITKPAFNFNKSCSIQTILRCFQYVEGEVDNQTDRNTN